MLGKEVILTLRRQLQLPLPNFHCGTAVIYTLALQMFMLLMDFILSSTHMGAMQNSSPI